MSARMLDIFLIEHHRAYGRIGRGGDTSSYNFIRTAYLGVVWLVEKD